MSASLEKVNEYAGIFLSLINTFGNGDLNPDSKLPLILALSALAEIDAPDQGPYYLEDQSFGLDRESISSVVEDIHHDVLRTIKFLEEFSTLYCKNTEEINLHFVSLYPDLITSILESMSINREDNLSLLRDWLSCYGTSNQFINFEKRCYNVIEKHNEYVSEAFFQEEFKRYPLGGQIDELYSMIGFLEILAHSITYPEPEKTLIKVKRHSFDNRHDPFGTPPRLRLLAHMLRDELGGKRVATKELMALSRTKDCPLDPGQIIAQSRGATKHDITWAKKHLQDGRGWWRWKPPTTSLQK